MKHSYVDITGYHELRALENQVLVLLLMSWFVADQYTFYFRDIVKGGRYGFDALAMTVGSDKLSGDDDLRPMNERRLRWLIDPEHDQRLLTEVSFYTLTSVIQPGGLSLRVSPRGNGSIHTYCEDHFGGIFGGCARRSFQSRLLSQNSR